MPRPLARFTAGRIAACSYPFVHGIRHVARANLRHVTGVDGRQLDRLCRAKVINFGRMLADYFLCTVAPPSRVRALLDDWSGWENIEAARAAGKGAVLVTAHVGNWELGGIFLSLLDLPVTVVTLEEPTSELTRLREEYRRRLGIKTITVGDDRFAFVDIVQALRRGEFVAMLVDRPHGETGEAVEFFGQPIPFSTGPAMLWQHTGAAILPAFVLEKKNGRYVSFVESPVPFEATGDAKADCAANTQRLAATFERIIRDHPDQWYNFVAVFEAAGG